MLRPCLGFILASLVTLVGCTEGSPSMSPILAPSSQPSSILPATKILAGCVPDADAPECSLGAVVLPDADGPYTLRSDTTYTLQLDFTRPPAGSCQTYRLTFSWIPYDAYPWPCGASITFWQGVYIPKGHSDHGDERIDLVVTEYGPDSSVTRSENQEILIHVRD